MGTLDGFETYAQDAMASWHCPGVAVAIVQGDELLHQSAHGWRDVERQLPLTVDTRFAMASVTKAFTAMSVALLVDEGTLAWDTPVREYLPEFLLDDPYATQHVSVRDMLSHRTGMPRHDLAAWRLDVSRAEFVGRMRHLRFSASFRERYQYNNLMYYAAAHLVERVAGRPWEDLVRERIFEPLAMDATNLVPQPPRPGLVNAEGYRVDRDDDGGVRGLQHMPFGPHTALSPGAAGALFSTLSDLVSWLGVHVNGGRAGDVQLVSPGALAQMHLPQTVVPVTGMRQALLGDTIATYGMGWEIQPYRGHTLVRHGGNVEGHSLMIGFVPQHRLGVVSLTNIAQLPLAELLLYEAIDRSLGLPERGWNDRFHAAFDPVIAGQARSKRTAAQERLPDAAPSRSTDAYEGTFGADGYPSFEVGHDAGALRARLLGSLPWSTLRHYHYDVFEWHLTDFDHVVKIRFLGSDTGEIDAVAIPIEPEVGDVTFRRAPPDLSDDVIAALLGTYDTPIAGVSLTITAHDGALSLTRTASAPESLTAYKLDAATVGLRSARARLDFARDGERITRLTLKEPGLTLEATKRA